MKKVLLALILLAYASCFYGQRKHCFMVGISNYGNAENSPEKWSNISGANDIKLLAPRFVEKGFEIDTIVDEFATYQNIKKGLDKLIRKSSQGDLVYIHFSCHGQPYEDLNGDEEDGWDEALIPVDAQMYYQKGSYEGTAHLLDDELEKYLSQIRYKIGATGMLYVVLDACHSGNSSRGDEEHIRGTNEGFTSNPDDYYQPDRTKDTNDNFKIELKQGESHVIYMEACRSYQTNREIRDSETNIWYGALSYYISKVLAKSDITVDASWVEAIQSEMAKNKYLRKQNMVIESSLKSIGAKSP